MWVLASGRSLPRNVRPDQLSEEELIGFWADDLSPATGHHAARVPVSGQVCAMLTFDIAGFTRPDRDEETRIHIHKAFYGILREALPGSGIPWGRCHHEDRGDGVLVVASPDIPPHGIIDPFPERLRGMIRVYNRMSAPPARIRVRAAAHIGPVYRDDHGLIGDDINLLFRMLDAEPLHTAVADSDAELALAISEYMYDSLVRRHPALASQTLFRQVNTEVKGTPVNAWMHLPGVPAQLQPGLLVPAGPGRPARVAGGQGDPGGAQALDQPGGQGLVVKRLGHGGSLSALSRLAGMTMLAGHLAEAGLLAPGRGVAEARDELWALGAVEVCRARLRAAAGPLTP